MDNCIFCKIIDGRIPSTKVYEDEYCVAFRDIAPQMPVHIVVAAKKHVPSVLGFCESEKEFLGGIQLAIAKIAAQEGLNGGYRIVSNCGSDAGQTVHHLHFHILGGERMSDHMA